MHVFKTFKFLRTENVGSEDRSGGGAKGTKHRCLWLRIAQTWSSIVNSEFLGELQVLGDWELRLCMYCTAGHWHSQTFKHKNLKAAKFAPFLLKNFLSRKVMLHKIISAQPPSAPQHWDEQFYTVSYRYLLSKVSYIYVHCTVHCTGILTGRFSGLS